MISFDEFIWKYYNAYIDYDHYYGNQCFDLYRQYVQEVLGFPQSPAVSGAAQIWDTYLKDYFIRIPNTPTGIPQKGDIMIWNKNAGGGYGHVAIVHDGDIMKFTSLDQNWVQGSPCRKVLHNYNNTLGWLHPKK